MKWNDIVQTIVGVLLAIVPGVVYPYLRDYADQKKREFQEAKDDQFHQLLLSPFSLLDLYNSRSRVF